MKHAARLRRSFATSEEKVRLCLEDPTRKCLYYGFLTFRHSLSFRVSRCLAQSIHRPQATDQTRTYCSPGVRQESTSRPIPKRVAPEDTSTKLQILSEAWTNLGHALDRLVTVVFGTYRTLSTVRHLQAARKCRYLLLLQDGRPDGSFRK